MKAFEPPKIEIIHLENADIITLSDNDGMSIEDPLSENWQGGKEG